MILLICTWNWAFMEQRRRIVGEGHNNSFLDYCIFIIIGGQNWNQIIFSINCTALDKTEFLILALLDTVMVRNHTKWFCWIKYFNESNWIANYFWHSCKTVGLLDQGFISNLVFLVGHSNILLGLIKRCHSMKTTTCIGQKFQCIHNIKFVIIIYIKGKREHITAILASLHWLPVHFIMDFKFSFTI